MISNLKASKLRAAKPLQFYLVMKIKNIETTKYSPKLVFLHKSIIEFTKNGIQSWVGSGSVRMNTYSLLGGMANREFVLKNKKSCSILRGANNIKQNKLSKYQL